MNTKSIMILIQFCLMVSMGYSQCKEWNWPTDKKTAEEKVALLQDAMTNKRYRQASKPLRWLIENAPQLNTSIYIYGATIYDELASREKTASLKKKYTDSLMLMYDLRIQHCGQMGYVLNRKATSAFKYDVNGAEPAKVLLLMDSAIAVNKFDTSDGLLFPYMQTMVIVQSKSKTLTEDDILSRYEKITNIIDYKINQAKNNPKALSKLKKYKTDMDEWLLKIMKPDCEFVKNNLGPKFKQNPTDLILAKRIFTFLVNGKCANDSLWMKAGAMIFDQEKDFSLGKILGLQFLASGNTAKAETYFNEIMPMASNKTDSAEVYYYKGSIEARGQNKAKARDYYWMSTRLDAKRKDAFERIGDLYYESFSDCAKMQSQAVDRLIYLAAYEYYAKAENQKKMLMAKRQFPSKEEIFLINQKVGEKVKVNCWVNEEVVVRTRD